MQSLNFLFQTLAATLPQSLCGLHLDPYAQVNSFFLKLPLVVVVVVGFCFGCCCVSLFVRLLITATEKYLVNQLKVEGENRLSKLVH